MNLRKAGIPAAAALAAATLCLPGACGPAHAGTAAAATPATGSGTTVLFDGFESGNTLAWSRQEPPLTPAEAYRAADLDLRDPHVFLNVPGFGCQDFTDNPAGGGLIPSFNSQLAATVTGDGDGDLLLDLSLLVGFRPLDLLAADGRLDRGLGACTAPGGAGNCAAGDDRDVHGGESGWWFYFDYSAEPVSFVGD